MELKREGRMYQAPNAMHFGSNNIKYVHRIVSNDRRDMHGVKGLRKKLNIDGEIAIYSNRISRTMYRARRPGHVEDMKEKEGPSEENQQ
eukprot:scaffold134009_cov43-Attheya_sp.AAC.1